MQTCDCARVGVGSTGFGKSKNMTPQEAKAYNEKNNLTGKPNEILVVVGPRGRQELMTRKNLALVKGFRLYEPHKVPSPIGVADLSDDVLAIEQERQRLAKENEELKAQLSVPRGTEAPPAKKIGRPKKNPVNA